MKSPASWEWEHKYRAQRVRKIVGIDEVGRGCWAGPLVAVAYSFARIPTEIEVGDSKTISEKQRILLMKQLKKLGAFGLGEVSSMEIDTLGLEMAQHLAYDRAIEALPFKPDILLLDGRPWTDCSYACEAIIDGDAKVASIAAASIIAKVHRDTLMKEDMHDTFPQYGFNKHVGYGTKLHADAIAKHGICDLHRKSFKPIRKIAISQTT